MLWTSLRATTLECQNVRTDVGAQILASQNHRAEGIVGLPGAPESQRGCSWGDSGMRKREIRRPCGDFCALEREKQAQLPSDSL